MPSLVSIDFTEGILIITINRPEARNAISYDTALQLSAAFDEMDARDDVRIGILTGAGGTFSSGMDLKDFAKTRKRSAVEGKGFGGLNEAPPQKPLIAAVEGYAVAGGFEMVLACDLIVAANNANFGLPEVKRGLVAGAGGLVRLPRQIPYHIAMEVLLTGDMLSATRAHQFGLVNVMADPGQALSQAINLARRICENGPLAIQTVKRVVNKGLDFPAADMFDLQRPLIDHIFLSEDAKEGATAFAEKRKPAWQGK
jgi:enoyl-CoA hydratase